MTKSPTVPTEQDAEQTEAAAPAPWWHRYRGRWWVRHYTSTGTLVGLIFDWLSLTPSLLPRGP
ncbi:MAG: hypothetical protein K2X97_08440, partial [Mycobacteriaceae bacterium]|nr:hypothetical protein [Mycobacteriaceae bacterium]